MKYLDFVRLSLINEMISTWLRECLLGDPELFSDHQKLKIGCICLSFALSIYIHSLIL